MKPEQAAELNELIETSETTDTPVITEGPPWLGWRSWWLEFIPASSGGRLVLIVVVVLLSGILLSWFGITELEPGERTVYIGSISGLIAAHLGRRTLESRHENY